MTMTKILYSNCSEIVWRLVGYRSPGRNEFETDTSTYPNGCLDNMIGLLSEAKGCDYDITHLYLDIIDNMGGGGDSNSVETTFKIAQSFVKGDITRERAEELDNGDFDGDIDIILKKEGGESKC